MLKVLSDSGVRERVLHCTLVTDSRSLTSSQHNSLCDQLTLLQTLVIIHCLTISLIHAAPDSDHYE